MPPPPDAAEQAAIEDQLVDLWVHAGATLTPDPGLGADLVAWPGRGLAFNHVARPRWSEATWGARADAVAARFRGLGEVPAILLVDELATPPGLSERLLGRGWLEIGRERILWTRRAAAVPHLAPSLRLEAVTPASAGTYEATERAIFGLAPAEAADRVRSLQAGLERGRVRAYLARLDGTPVATARLVRSDGLAALQGVGVITARRREGFGTLMTTVATRAGLAGGARLVWLSVEAGNAAAEALYAGLDYRPVLTWRRLIAPEAAGR
ncbi:MAG TPA: GNAT family N-acetyltransferase [Candidatus Sulfotelmatobacter sp.]|nr:GNAT family N-acetyltransferase [Candidatus Sulfotelmatobacter sp.]